MTSAFVPSVVYALCSLTSIVCAAIVLRSWWSRRQQLLLLVGLCFAVMAFSNLLLVVDLVLLPAIDLALARAVTSLLAAGGLVFALVVESAS